MEKNMNGYGPPFYGMVIDDVVLKEYKEQEQQEFDIAYILRQDELKVKLFDDEEFANWITTQHKEYCDVISMGSGIDFLDDQTYQGRKMITKYMNDLSEFLHVRNINNISEKVANILYESGMHSLLSILTTLNYI